MALCVQRGFVTQSDRQKVVRHTFKLFGSLVGQSGACYFFSPHVRQLNDWRKR